MAIGQILRRAVGGQTEGVSFRASATAPLVRRMQATL